MAIRAYVPTSPGAGDLRSRIAFDKRQDVDDGYGNTQSDFIEQFTQSGALLPLKGGETVMASRLTGVQPFILTVRHSSQAAQVTTAWRARDARTGTVYDITTVVVRPTKDFIDMTCVSG